MQETAVFDTTERQHRSSFHSFAQAFQENFRRATDDGKEPLFRAVLGGMRKKLALGEIYLESFPPEIRQHYNCHECRQFIKKYGRLVTVTASGKIRSAVWNPEVISSDVLDAPFLRKALAAMRDAVELSGRVEDQFFSKDLSFGVEVTGEYHHFSVLSKTSDAWFSKSYMTAHQESMVKSQNTKSVRRAANEFSIKQMNEVLALFEQEALDKSEQYVGPAQWLLERIQEKNAATSQVVAENLLRKAVAAAPDGFCHPRKGMIGSLLNDMGRGLSFQQVKRNFNDRVSALKYLRPKAAPSQGTVVQAEKLVETLGIQSALPRRFAKVEELRYEWTPSPAEVSATAKTGVFSGVRTKEDQSSLDEAESVSMAEKAPPRHMTWVKFADEVLPEASEIKLDLPSYSTILNGFTAAVNADAKPIFSWDSEEERNSISVFMLTSPTTPEVWGVKGLSVSAHGLALFPWQWGRAKSHLKNGVMAVLDAGSSRLEPGSCLFPEVLRSELHGVRSVIESFSNSTPLQGKGERRAVGVLLIGTGVVLKVKSKGRYQHVMLDRWD